jgi:PEGA domain
MASMPTTADVHDHLDPWGFGRSEAAAAEIEPAQGLPTRRPDAPPAPRSAEQRDVRLWSSSRKRTAAPAPHPSGATSASGGSMTATLPREMLGVLAVFGFVILAQAFYIGYSMVGASADAGTGELLVSSHPKGLQVLVDGRIQGITPLSARIPAGSHVVEVMGPLGVPEQFTADVVAGEQWTQHVELAGPAHKAETTSTLRIETGDALAQVEIDGALIGSTPLTHTALSPGDHVVRATFARGGTVERPVRVAAGETLALVMEPPAVRPVTPAGPVSGWVRVEAPFPVQVFENGSLVGSNDSERLMMSAGGHALELVNAALGYRVTVKAVVTPGKVTPLAVELPKVPVHINAQPWAEVLVDGRAVGDTPLANLMLPIGPHEVVLRHPELGQRVQTITVRAAGPNRIGADLRK